MKIRPLFQLYIYVCILVTFAILFGLIVYCSHSLSPTWDLYLSHFYFFTREVFYKSVNFYMYESC